MAIAPTGGLIPDTRPGDKARMGPAPVIFAPMEEVQIPPGPMGATGDQEHGDLAQLGPSPVVNEDPGLPGEAEAPDFPLDSTHAI